MQAVLFQSRGEGPIVSEATIPEPADGEIRIQLHYASLNHLDLWIWNEKTLSNPVISGSDGSGVVEKIGPGVDKSWIGKEVVINPSLYWGTDEKIFSDQYQILGYPTNGTFAEYICMPQEYVFEKPTHLSIKEAAALPLAARRLAEIPLLL